MLAVGGTTALNVAQFSSRFEINGVLRAAELRRYRSRLEFGTWLACEFDRNEEIPLESETLQRTVIVCANLLEQFENPAYLLEHLRKWLEHAPVCIVTSAERDLTQSKDGNGRASSARSTQTGKWNLAEFEQLLRSAGFNLEFIGLTASDNVNFEKKNILAVLTNNALPQPMVTKAPEDFRVIAFMAAYNEEDIIVQSIRKWAEQGVSVHVLENWSTDATYDLAKALEGHLPVTVERFPKDGPSPHFDWGAMLGRMEELSGEIKADWFVRRGADEVLMSPWPGVSYRDGLYRVEQAGYNCVDHAVIEFHPVDDGFAAGADHEAYFRHFDFGTHFSHFQQRKAWKNYGQPISMAQSGGHDVPFEGRRVYPFKFLLKHYPVRSQQHGEKKVFRERKARWNPLERAKGWHVHYDAIGKGHQFVRNASEQLLFDEEHFHQTFLVERLSSIGVLR